MTRGSALPAALLPLCLVAGAVWAGVRADLPAEPLACAAAGSLLLIRLREQWRPVEPESRGRTVGLRLRLLGVIDLLEPAVLLLLAVALLYPAVLPGIPAAAGALQAGLLLAGAGMALAATRTLPASSRLVAVALMPLVFAGALVGPASSALLLFASGCALLCIRAHRAAFMPLVAYFAAVASLVIVGGPGHVAQAGLLSALGVLLARRWSLGSWRFTAALVMAASVCAAGVLSLAVPAEGAAWGVTSGGDGLLPGFSGVTLWPLLVASATAGLLVRARCGTLQERMQAELFLFLISASAVWSLAGEAPGVPADVAAVMVAGYGARWWTEVLG